MKCASKAFIRARVCFRGNLGLSDKFSGRFMGRRIFTAPGNITYQPSSGTRKIKIILTGGGGHGYGFLGWGENYRSRGAGGGAGATAIAWLDVDDSKTYAGIVGRGADDTLGATSSTFNGLLTAANGADNQGGDAGGGGGLAVGGDLNIQGGDGSDAPGIVGAANPYSGGSGDGGASYWGGGSRSGEGSTSWRKTIYGAGGGGNTRTDPYIGSFGSHGVIYIEEYS